MKILLAEDDDRVAAFIVNGLGGIFGAILRIARIETQSGKRDFKPLSLAPLLADMAETFGPVAEESGQTVTLLPSSQDARILGDARMLRQMLVNLIQNTMTHCPMGTNSTLRLRVEDQAVTFELADDGPGIPEGDRTRVFEPFYRLDRNRTTKGSGLGLALVKAIAERHGATIHLSDNRPGLKVTIRFPPEVPVKPVVPVKKAKPASTRS